MIITRYCLVWWFLKSGLELNSRRVPGWNKKFLPNIDAASKMLILNKKQATALADMNSLLIRL
jgi:hypothetical protein